MIFMKVILLFPAERLFQSLILGHPESGLLIKEFTQIVRTALRLYRHQSGQWPR